MPTYQYACTECSHELEAVQSFTDDPLTRCPECAGRLRKLYGSVGVVFKGPGFYRTDSRNDSRTSSANGKSDTDGKGSTDGKSGAEGASGGGTSGADGKGSADSASAGSTAGATKDNTGTKPKADATSGASSSS